MESIRDTYTLHNGVVMPKLGLGVWKTKDGDEVEHAVMSAIDAGYRLIDTASLYDNETGVGRAIAANSVDREELFITTKVWNTDQGYQSTLDAFDVSMNKLGLEYLDLYLIHWPTPSMGLHSETWRALEELYTSGHVRAIGVSNFQPHHIDELMTTATIAPMVNQVELHPYFQQRTAREYDDEHGIITQSWSPIGAGSGLLGESVLSQIGEAYGKSPAQVVIRWHLQHGLAVIPKSVHQQRIIENSNVFDFVISPEHMALIDGLETGERLGPDPDNVNF